MGDPLDDLTFDLELSPRRERALVARERAERTRAEQERVARANAEAAARVALDCPLLPTSDADATPQVPEEPGDGLTPQQRLAVAALVGGQTAAAAARAAGCARRTIFNWQTQPAFRDAVETRSREALDVVVTRVRNLMLRATRVIGESLLDESKARASLNAMRVINSSRCWTALARPGENRPDDATPGHASDQTPA